MGVKPLQHARFGSERSVLKQPVGYHRVLGEGRECGLFRDHVHGQHRICAIKQPHRVVGTEAAKVGQL
jgi:hypothetical protein